MGIRFVPEQAIDISSKQDIVAGVSDTEIGYLDGVTSGIQTQLNDRAISHNYIINGAFDVWQRGTSFVNSSGLTRAADLWTSRFIANRLYTISQQVFNSAEIEAIGFGDANTYLDFAVEGTDIPRNGGLTTLIEDVRTLAGQAVVVSAWVKSSSDAGMSLKVAARQNFGLGGSSVVVTDSTATNTLTSAWQRYEWKINLPSISGNTVGDGSNLEITFISDDATDYGFQIWGVQLEAGSVATPFKRHAPSLQGELAACQRYYYRIQPGAINRQLGFGYQANSTVAGTLGNFPVTMRRLPTALETSGNAADYMLAVPTVGNIQCSAVPAYSSSTSENVFQANFTVPSGLTAGQTVRSFTDSVNGANAFLAWSAEL
jgi:hypothetical protein